VKGVPKEILVLLLLKYSKAMPELGSEKKR